MCLWSLDKSLLESVQRRQGGIKLGKFSIGVLVMAVQVCSMRPLCPWSCAVGSCTDRECHTEESRCGSHAGLQAALEAGLGSSRYILPGSFLRDKQHLPHSCGKCCVLLFLAALLGVLCLSRLLWDQQGWSWHSNLYSTSVLSFELQGLYSTALLLQRCNGGTLSLCAQM